MSKIINQKLFLIDEDESFYIFKNNEFEPKKILQNIFFKEDFDFIISSKNKLINNYFVQLESYNLGFIVDEPRS